MLTLDRELAAAARGRSMPIPDMHPPGLSEQPAPYGEPVDWARFGPYLARLRADAHETAEA